MSSRSAVSDIAVGGILVLFGVSEVYAAFAGRFFGIQATAPSAYASVSALVGVLAIAAGILTLTRRHRAFWAATVLLLADAAGRVILVATGLYPVNSLENVVAMVVGTALVVAFAAYLWRRFQGTAGSASNGVRELARVAR